MEKEALRYTVNLDRLIERLQELRRQHGDLPCLVGEPEGKTAIPGVSDDIPAKRALSLLECDLGALHPSASHAVDIAPTQLAKAEEQGWTKVVLVTGWDGRSR